MNRILAAYLFCCLQFICAGAARASDEEIFAGSRVDVVSDEDLDTQRGGFSWGGLDVSVGAELKSYISDNLVAETDISWQDAQAQIQHTYASTVSPVSASQLAGILAANNIGAVPGSFSGFVTNDGQTALIQQTNNSLQNILVNSANGAVLRQQLDATINITGFAPFQAGLVSNQLGSSLSSAIGMAGIGRW